MATPHMPNFGKPCVTCGSDCVSPRKIGSEAGRRRCLSQLIAKYSKTTIIDGYVCKSCVNKMERFESTAQEQANFLASCASQASGMKRTSEAVSPQSCSTLRTVAGRKKRLFYEKTVRVAVDSDVLAFADDIRDLFDRADKNASTATTVHHVDRATEHVAVDAIGAVESARLQSCMTTYSAFVEALVRNDTIYNLLIDRLAKDIDLQAVGLSCKNKSVLRQKGFEGLNNFN
jgi:hypothetical protein